MGVDIPWVYAKLKLAVPLDNTKDRYTAKAFDLFNECVQYETGKTPKQWYEGKVVESVPKAGKKGGDRKSEEYQRNNVPLIQAKGNSREARIAQLKKAGRDDLVKQVADGSLSANEG